MQHILIMGSGAVGGFYGAHLASASGLDVTFVARGKHLDAMRLNGLRITGKKKLRLEQINVIDDPAQIPQSPDLILLTVKSFDTTHAIEQIQPIVRSHTSILTLQNGLENYDLLVSTFGSQRVIRGFCKIGVEVTMPGVIDFRGMSHMVFGEENGSSSNRVLQLQKIMEHAGIDCSVSRDIRKVSWKKFIWNGIFNMLTGISGVTTNHIFEDDDAYATACKLFYEMQTIAGAEGITISDQEGKEIIDGTKKLGAFRTSTLQDRLKGKSLEFDAFCGYIVRKADQYNLTVTANRTLFSLYKLMTVNNPDS